MYNFDVSVSLFKFIHFGALVEGDTSWEFVFSKAKNYAAAKLLVQGSAYAWMRKSGALRLCTMQSH